MLTFFIHATRTLLPLAVLSGSVYALWGTVRAKPRVVWGVAALLAGGIIGSFMFAVARTAAEAHLVMSAV